MFVPAEAFAHPEPPEMASSSAIVIECGGESIPPSGESAARVIPARMAAADNADPDFQTT
jgi:hypothetical protein